MSITLDSISPAAVDRAGGAKMVILGDFSEHLGQDFEALLVSRDTDEEFLALSGRPGSPTVIQPQNASRMVAYAPRLRPRGSYLLRDDLDSDQGYWNIGGGGSISFSGGFATVYGGGPAEVPGFQDWSSYSIRVEIRGTSLVTGGNGGFGVTSHFTDNDSKSLVYIVYLNTIDNNLFAATGTGVGFPIVNLYSYSPFGTLVGGQWYDLEYRVRRISGTTMRVECLIDGALIFTEEHTGYGQRGAVGLSTGGPAQGGDYNNLVVESFIEQGQDLGDFYTPRFNLVVRRTEGDVADTLADSLRALSAQHNTGVFGLRSVLPPTYRTGPRNPGLLERI